MALNPIQVREAKAKKLALLKKANEQLLQKKKFQMMETPYPTGSLEIIPTESSPDMQNEISKVQKEKGASFPMPTNRPQQPSKIKEDGSVIVAKSLAPQMGTSPEILMQNRIDERKFAVLNPGTLSALSHFSFRHIYYKIRYWGHITEWELVGSQGIGGLTRRHVLQLMANSKGVSSISKAKKPNVIARNTFDRNWQEKAEREGKVVDE
jgi:hypothetical protein